MEQKTIINIMSKNAFDYSKLVEKHVYSDRKTMPLVVLINNNNVYQSYNGNGSGESIMEHSLFTKADFVFDVEKCSMLKNRFGHHNIDSQDIPLKIKNLFNVSYDIYMGTDIKRLEQVYNDELVILSLILLGRLDVFRSNFDRDIIDIVNLKHNIPISKERKEYLVDKYPHRFI